MANYVVAGSRVAFTATIVERTNGSTTPKNLSGAGISVDCLSSVDGGAETETACSLTTPSSGVVDVTLPAAAVTEGRKLKVQWRVNAAGQDPLLTKPILLPVL